MAGLDELDEVLVGRNRRRPGGQTEDERFLGSGLEFVDSVYTSKRIVGRGEGMSDLFAM